MSGRPYGWMALLAAVGCLSAAGCGSNPPCNVDISEVESARTAAQTAESKLDELKKEKADLEKQIAAEQTRRDDLERRKAELEAKIAALGG